MLGGGRKGSRKSSRTSGLSTSSSSVGGGDPSEQIAADEQKRRRRAEKKAQPLRADEYEGKELWWYEPDVQTILNHGNVDELPAEAKGYFNQQKQLMEYYVVQLNLFGDMAMDRSYNAIEQLEEELRYDVLVRMLVNDLLPDAIRAAATTLVLRLYVDRSTSTPRVARSIQFSSFSRANLAAGRS